VDKKLTFLEFLQLSEAELKAMAPANVAVRNKPNLIDKSKPLDPDSYEYRQRWRGKPKTKAGREAHEVAYDVKKNHEKLAKRKETSSDFKPLKGYLSPRPPREGNRN
jgi:hypothetical protein